MDDVDALQMMWDNIFIIFFFFNLCYHINACGGVADVRGQPMYIFCECMMASRCMLWDGLQMMWGIFIFIFWFSNAC